MKQQVTNRTVVKVLTLCAAILFVSTSLNATITQPFNTTDPVNLKVKYVGENNGQPVYSVQFENPENQVQAVYIRDVDGTELFSENVKGTEYSRKFQLNLPNLGSTKVVVTLVDSTGKESNYMVNSKVTIVETAEVTKI